MLIIGNKNRRYRNAKLDQAAIDRNHRIAELYDRYHSALMVSHLMQLPESVVRSILRGYFGIKKVY